MKFKRQVPYEILITPTVNDGFLVKCGCVVAVYANHNDLIMDLREYLEHPVEVEKQYNHDIAGLCGDPAGAQLWANRGANMERVEQQAPISETHEDAPQGGLYNENL